MNDFGIHTYSNVEGEVRIVIKHTQRYERLAIPQVLHVLVRLIKQAQFNDPRNPTTTYQL